MTTVLNVLIEDSIVHASDRLLTVGKDPWDPFANKTVVHWGRMHIAVVGYSGAAYVGGKPTDQWIAEHLSGENLTTRAAMQVASSTERANARAAVQALTDAANVSFDQLATDPPVIMFDGWQDRRGTPRPISARIARGSNGYAASWEDMPRHLRASSTYFMHNVGVLEVHDQQRAKAEMTSVRSLEDVRDVLVRTIRRTADRSQYVGRDVMTVTIPTHRTVNGMLRVTVRFVPSPERLVVLRRLLQTEESRPIRVDSFSPWIIHPWGVMFPSLIGIGGGANTRWQVPVGRPQLEVLFEAPGLSDTGNWYMRSQPRPSWPPPPGA